MFLNNTVYDGKCRLHSCLKSIIYIIFSGLLIRWSKVRILHDPPVLAKKPSLYDLAFLFWLFYMQWFSKPLSLAAGLEFFGFIARETQNTV